MNDDHVHQVYSGEEGSEATRVLTRARIHWTVEQVPEGTVLDVGCSQGTVSILLAERGAAVVGVDNEQQSLAFAERLREKLDPDVRRRVEFMEGDAEELPFEPQTIDHVVCTEVLEHVEDPNRVVAEIFRVLRPGGTLVLTVPFGVMPHPDHKRVFYPHSLSRLLDPMFERRTSTVLERHIGFVGERRQRNRGHPEWALSDADEAFRTREEELRAKASEAMEKLTEANLKYRNATASNRAARQQAAKGGDKAVGTAERLAGELRAQNRKLEEQLAEAERHLIAARKDHEDLRVRVTELRASVRAGDRELAARKETASLLRERVTRLEDELEKTRALLEEGQQQRRRVREQRRRRCADSAEQRTRLLALATRQGEVLDRLEARVPEIRASLQPPVSKSRPPADADPQPDEPRERTPLTTRAARDELDGWCERAMAAPGDEIVFMYSGTIHIQDKRGNRPIRLTRVYLDQDRPVFFNYWRWKTDDPPPEYTHPLLFQSPVDMTPELLDRLLEADFGGKRKLMFASFPHELMVRSLSRAAQHGWVTIYDARDDWEEFQKVGMAKWYDRGFEEFLVRHSDVVTAVSEPLARKLGEMGNRQDIEVVPNGLDINFPSPPGPRRPSQPPIVGYFGHLTPKWFDWDLVVRAARQHPDWKFELAGHQHPEDLELPDNIELLGLLGHPELAELSRRWSFAVIPFKVSALGEAVDPIKVYEYLHLGLPVLSSYMPQMRDYPATVIAESSDDFLALLPTMTEMPLDPDAVRPWLEVNTWQDRIDRFSKLGKQAQLSHGELGGFRGLLACAHIDAGQEQRTAVRVEERLAR